MPNRPGLAAMFLLITALAGCAVLAGCTHPSPAPPAPGATVASPSPSTRTSGHARPSTLPATFPGSDGTEARWVIQENERSGTTAWKIRGHAAGVAGFAGQVYATAGQQVTLYVSTAAPWFRARAFRMGWYHGRGARLVWTSAQVKGKNQPACRVRAGVSMVVCDTWSPSLTFRITPAFVQGDYLIKLTAPGNRQSYVPLTIWDPASTATYVVKNDVFTWQAWNFYGGYDYYQGRGDCPPGVYPICNRARVVSYDRPYAAEQGSGNFLGLEYPLVRWAEQHGLDVTYATDLTLPEHLLARRSQPFRRPAGSTTNSQFLASVAASVPQLTPVPDPARTLSRPTTSMLHQCRGSSIDAPSMSLARPTERLRDTAG